MKACPMCAEEIQDAALICRHCGASATPDGWVARGPAAMGGGGGTSTNGLAIASLVLGILWLYWVGSILALIFGYVAKRQIRDSMGRQTGGGMATAGIVLGWIGVATLAIVIVVAIVAAGSSDPSPYR